VAVAAPGNSGKSSAIAASIKRGVAPGERRVVAADLAGRAVRMVEEGEVVDGDHLRRGARRHQQRVGRMHHVETPAGDRFDRRPAGPVPGQVEQPPGDAAVHGADGRGQRLVGILQAVLPGRAEHRDLERVAAGSRIVLRFGERGGQMVHEHADTCRAAQCRPIVNQDAHAALNHTTRRRAARCRGRTAGGRRPSPYPSVL